MNTDFDFEEASLVAEIEQYKAITRRIRQRDAHKAAAMIAEAGFVDSESYSKYVERSICFSVLNQAWVTA